MNMSRWLVLILSLSLGACAHTSARNGPEGKDSQVLESSNSRARVHTELAAQYYSRRQYGVASQELQEALQADGSYAPAYNMLGLLHGALLETKEAEANFQRALDMAPQYSEAHNNFGYFLCSQRRYAEALSQFERAWQNPLYVTPEKALANAGQCALHMGNTDEAEQLAKRALVRAPNQPQALVTLADIQFRQGNIAMARGLLSRADGQGGLDAPGLWLAVRVERQAGNRESEAEYGAQLRRRYPESRETAWLLNGQFDKQGDGR
ncbi:MAG: type IV pilus biogenesis/stability protein PilW [Hydrogenophilales bacterium CG03_land_8_20_14_0_80_62_28]|nr:type IV pilus biogenesis/stability protein PilW [Betaproteobacteria bacterium]PIV22796.1 MAG: type IV pilus biogenesis/stability protein PilW [Hydrogenophilales bacterium CG03_land_8_20_14_0_80_62_28]PIW39475.1 MAG: type IV pilus biogenesis/stability protein PilW [Hydrogenophilales bacterium CG15_BIG_FIL_POST_REV_8_21_14_020_62_31]PIW72689.1 MAG: type IV pilus biogenesis/stability protein PilW [Hydrogenophilales bacterium CG12_big_fil_rev_8_21_14_0_65_61_21]PIX01486.1 MAG: type IV pilus biog